MKLEQAARQALEALERASAIMDSSAQQRQDDAITALREALAEQEKPLYRKVLREMLDAHEQAEQEQVMITPGGGAFPFAVVGELEQAEQEPQHSEHYWQHEINNARADGYERGYVAAKKLYAEQAEQEPVAYTNSDQLGYLKDPLYENAPMAMWSKPFDKRINVSLYAAPVRTKDLTVSELDAIIEKHYDDEMDLKAMILDGIAADREKNK